MKQKCLALFVLAAGLGLSPWVAAQELEERRDERMNGRVDDRRDDRRAAARFGDAGQLALSAERMFGANFAWDSIEEGDEDTTSTTFNVSVLSNPLANVTNTYTFPRVGIDYFVVDNVSIGAALGFAYSSFDDDAIEFAAIDSLTAFLAAPRVGYAYMFTDHIGIWPRAGVTWLWVSANGEGDIDQTANRFALTVEAPFVIVPTDNVAILVGPTFDLGLAGTNTLTGTNGDLDVDVRATELGVQFGLVTYF